MVSLDALRKKVLEQTRKKLEQAYAEKDRYVIQAIESLDDVDAVFNLLVSRVREWYSLHFPELVQKVKDHEEFLKLVKEYGKRENFPDKYRELAENSAGSSIGDEDIKILQKLASLALDIRRFREELVDYISQTMEEVAPNVKYLAGPLLGARLIAKAGGLKKLASYPASTIQVLGAEKALFRHLTKGTRPPKHGVLFQHPLIRNAPRWQRGKIARSFAAKLAIAAREDYFGGRFIADKLKEELDERIKEIKEKYPKPPRRQRKKRRK